MLLTLSRPAQTSLAAQERAPAQEHPEEQTATDAMPAAAAHRAVAVHRAAAARQRRRIGVVVARGGWCESGCGHATFLIIRDF